MSTSSAPAPDRCAQLHVERVLQTAPQIADDLRASDAERDAVIDALARMDVLGRIDRAELEARVDAAGRAQTVTELRRVIADLPVDLLNAPREQLAPHAGDDRSRSGHADREVAVGAGGADTVAVVMIMGVVALLAAALMQFGAVFDAAEGLLVAIEQMLVPAER